MLRHDFRHYYGCAYPTEDVEETLDLIATLPDGSAYARATNPAREWDQSQHNTADVIDSLWQIQAARAGLDTANAPCIERPAQRVARLSHETRAREKAKRAYDLINNAEWEEVD